MQKVVAPLPKQAEAGHVHNPGGKKWTTGGLGRHLDKRHSKFVMPRSMTLEEMRTYHNELHGGTQFRSTSPLHLDNRAKQYQKEVALAAVLVFCAGALFGWSIRP